MRQYLCCIHKNGMSACWTLIWNTIFIQLLCQIFHLTDAGFQIIKFRILIQSCSKCIHVTTIHTTVSKISFILHAKAFGTFVPIFFSCSNEASHIDDTILLGTHSHTIRQVEHLFRNFLYRFTAIAIFTHFDEVSVFRKTCGVK